MHLRTFHPHRALRPFVRFYWILEPEAGGPDPERIVPGTECDMIVQLGPRANFKAGEGPWQTRRPVGFIEGHFHSYFMLRFSGPCRLVGVRFTSTGLFPLIKIPLDGLDGQFVNLSDFFPDAGDALVEQLMTSVSDEAIPDVLDRFLLRHLEPIADDGRLTEAVRVLTNANGRMRIRRLADELSWSERRLERVFNRHIGMSPEQYSQRLRLNHFIRKVRAGTPATFTQLAHDCFYADQSHLIRTFKKYTGMTPLDYFLHRHPIQFALNERA